MKQKHAQLPTDSVSKDAARELSYAAFIPAQTYDAWLDRG